MPSLGPYRLLAAVFLLFLLSGCGTLAYYIQAIDGHARLLHRTRSIEGLLESGRIPAALRERLQWVLEVRAFASRELALPDNDSYRGYAALEGEAVAWSLVATPEFDLEPLQWCYPIIGCAGYRGWFDRDDAGREERRLAREGRDVVVAPVAAYSTLGWFDDPLPSTVMQWPDPELAGLIFHELAHQQLYLAGDSAFNESFATAVERAGVRRWLEQRGDLPALQAWERRLHREQAFVGLLRQGRERLQRLYARPLPVVELRRLKRAELGRLRRDYAALAATRGDAPGAKRWLERPLNNARLALVGTYEQWVPAFSSLLYCHDGDFTAFYRAAAALAARPREVRRQRLQALSETAAADQASRRNCR